MLENHKLTLYLFVARDVLRWLKPEGVWSAIDPAPMTTEEVVEVFEMIREHPRYERQLLRTETSDGMTVVLQNGLVSVFEEA